jgi:hypothetical protein
MRELATEYYASTRQFGKMMRDIFSNKHRSYCGKELSAWGKIMSDTITQMRLSMRLDAYLREYMEKNVSSDALSKVEWDTVWQVADVARTQSTLTPQLVDDVRKALQKL